MHKKAETPKSSKFLTNQVLPVLMVATLFLTGCVIFTAAQKRSTGNLKSVTQRKSVRAEKREKRSERERENEKPIEITRNGKKYVLSADQDLARTDQPSEAQQWYVKKRLAKGEKALSFEKYLRAFEKVKQMKRFSTVTNKVLPSYAEAPMLEADSQKISATANAAAGGSTGGVLGTWKNLGPGNVGGRTRSLLVDPTNTSIMYAGAVDGGIWKTTDAGASWNPLNDFLPNIAVTTLVFDPSNTNKIYAGTGEGFFNADGVRGAGIFVTTDAGATWNRLPSTAANADFFYVQKIVVSTANPQHVFAATRTGVQRSLDGGATWSNVLVSNAANGNNGAMDLAIRTDQATDYIYAAVGTFAQSHIFRNTDAGGAGTWVDVYTEATMGRTTLAIAPSNQNVIYALAAQTGATVAPASTYNDGLLSVFRSTSSGDTGTWTAQVRNNSVNKQDTILLSNPINAVLVECGRGATNNILNQGWYDNIIKIDPTDSDKVWIGGIDIWRSDNGGVNWGVASYWFFQSNGTPPANGDPQLVHADNHTIVFDPNYNGTTNQVVYIGDDGGVYKTTNAKDGNVGYVNGVTPSGGTVTPTSPICGNEFAPGAGYTVPNPVLWNPLNNGYQVTQFNQGLPYPNGNTFFGGTQDNGTNRGTIAGGPNGWERINGGDGGYVAVDPTNTNVLFVETTGLSLRKSTNGGASFVSAISGITGDTFPFYTVYLMDPSNPQRMYIAGRGVWRSNNQGSTWSRISATTPAITGGSITAIGVSPNPNTVLVGTASGRVARTTIATTATSATAWTILDTSPRGLNNGTISWIAFDPNNANTAYITYSTFNGAANANGTNVGHIYKTTDSGTTFTLVDGTQTAGNANAIPDVPAHSVVVDPNDAKRLYVGTDLGVFVTLDGGLNWYQETTGFSNVVTESVSLQRSNGVTSIFAFTHGRSAYKVTIPASCAAVPNSSRNVPVDGGMYTFSVVKNPGATAVCDWNAVSNSDFITLNSVTSNISQKTANADLSGADNGSVVITVAPNTTGANRTGTVTVAGTVITINQFTTPTAATVKIGGRVTTANGSGIGSARITLTDTQGRKRVISTNSFGYYSFDGVNAGTNYIIAAESKGRTFTQSSQLLNVTDDNNQINFVSSSR